MGETAVVNEVKETPSPESAGAKPTESGQTPGGEVVKETPKETPTGTVPYSRFSEVIAQKNEAMRKAQEYEARIKDFETRFKPQAESDPFDGLAPEEREQTQKFIDKFVIPSVRKNMLSELAPVIQEVQNEKLNKQIYEAQEFAGRVGINFDERLPEVVDFLSRPENKGRLTAKEAMLSLYGDEFLEKTRLKAREDASQETKELIEKKKQANMQVSTVNPNAVVHSDEMARKMMNPTERMQADIRKALELETQGVKNPKIRG